MRTIRLEDRCLCSCHTTGGRDRCTRCECILCTACGEFSADGVLHGRNCTNSLGHDSREKSETTLDVFEAMND